MEIPNNYTPKQTVYINGRFFTQSTTGVQRYAFEVLRALELMLKDPALAGEFDFVCLLPPGTDANNLPAWSNIRFKVAGKLNGNLWEQIELPLHAGNSLLLSLCNSGPIFHTKQILAIYDASVYEIPQAYSFLFKLKFRVVAWSLARRAKGIFTSSVFSQTELVRHLKITAGRISVIYGGGEHILRFNEDAGILTRNNLTHGSYLLAVGSSSPHKNMEGLIKAIRMNDTSARKLVIAGGNFSHIFKSEKSFGSDRIHHLGYVTDSELRTLYTHAAGFVFPSLYEGFGFPPLEAMSCGCPVVCSNAASIPEVCGDAALYFDPRNPEAINAQILQLEKIPELSQSLREKGKSRVQFFTWEKSAAALLHLIKKSLSAN